MVELPLWQDRADFNGRKMVELPLWQGGANFNGKKSGSNYRCGRDMSISTVKWSVGLPL